MFVLLQVSKQIAPVAGEQIRRRCLHRYWGAVSRTVRVAQLTRLRIAHGRWKMSPQFLCHDASKSDLNYLAGRNPMRMIPLAAAAFVASTSAVAQSWEEYSYPEYECAFAVVV